MRLFECGFVTDVRMWVDLYNTSGIRHILRLYGNRVTSLYNIHFVNNPRTKVKERNTTSGWQHKFCICTNSNAHTLRITSENSVAPDVLLVIFTLDSFLDAQSHKNGLQPA